MVYQYSYKILYTKKGLSAVIATVILVALTLAAVAILFTFVTDIVEKQTSKGTNCIDIIGEVELNSDYTCYNPESKELQFSINIKNAEIDSLLISVQDETLESEVLEIEKTPKSFNNLKYYPDEENDYNQEIKLPKKDSGKTYILNLGNFGTQERSIIIAPKIGEEQCQEADSISQIRNCQGY